MSLSKEEIQAFNEACKKNFQIYNQRIQSLESQARQSTEFDKLIRGVQQIQKELAEKDEHGKPRVALFDFKERQTRQQFRDRLNRLFASVNSANADDIQRKIQAVNVRITAGGFDEATIRSELKQIQTQSYAIPKSDGQKVGIEAQIRMSFDGLKQQLSSQQSDPQTENDISGIDNATRQVYAHISGLTVQTWASGDYSRVFEELKGSHRQLIAVQKQIRNLQEKLKTAQLPTPLKNRYYGGLQKYWHDQSAYWQHPSLTARFNFVETLSTDNFERFIGQLEEIENQAENNPSQDQIKKLHTLIKNLEKALGKNDQGEYPFPLKIDQRREFFGRAIGCKKRLSEIFGKVQSTADQAFQKIEMQCRSLYREYEEGKSRHDLEKVKKSCKQLHETRKEALQSGHLGPRNNHILMREINELWMNIDELIKKLAPEHFSIEWLQEAYLRNVQSGWLLFVDQVPKIGR